MKKPRYVEILIYQYEIRKIKNPKFSLRSFAKYLNIDSSTLSAIIKLKRPFPMSKLDWVVKKLNLDQELVHQFYHSAIQERFSFNPPKENANKKLLSEEFYFDFLAHWEYAAILSLFDLQDFKPTVAYISKKLNISKLRTKEIWNDLTNSKLILKNKNGEITRAATQFITPEDVHSNALKMAHLEELDLGMKKLHQISIEKRDYSSVMLAISKEALPQAKTLIRNFRNDFAKLLETNQADEVYILAIQFFPITNK